MATSSHSLISFHQMQHAKHASTEPEPHNRKRAAVACMGCRLKRTKCDGRQPRCGACQYRDMTCEYSNCENKRKRHSNEYIAALEARVASLEKRILEISGRNDPILTRSGNNDTLTHVKLSIGQTESNLNIQSTDTGDSGIGDLTDALGCFTIGDAGELRFFGSSSNFDIVQGHSLRVASSLEARMRGIAAAKSLTSYLEPSDELRDHLLALFWAWQNSWQYIVPREPFVRELYVSGPQNHCTPLLLNAILALASRYSDRPELRTDPDDANTAGEIFSAQAKSMLHYESDAPTTSTVQATALLGLYWAAVDREALGFMYIGMASRMAMNLGLHSDVSTYAANGLVSEEDVEVRKITFWGVYVLDKLYCLGMGRPAGIQEYNITTTRPRAVESEVNGLQDNQRKISSPWPTAHITENAMHMCEVLLITSEVFDRLYAQQSAWSEKERENLVVQTQLRLIKFFDDLPKTLKISESSCQPASPYVYQLHLQYHVSIIIMHRPFFRILSRGRSTVDYDPHGQEPHSRSCKAAAIKIANIFRIFKINYTTRCLPISAVHPAFTAAIIHLLDYMTTRDEARRKACQRFRICLDSLYGMNVNWDWANRSIRAVHSLAAQWNLDFDEMGVKASVSVESLAQFQKYESSCVPLGNIPDLGSTMSEIPIDAALNAFFEPWTHDDNFLNCAFDFL